MKRHMPSGETCNRCTSPCSRSNSGTSVTRDTTKGSTSLFLDSNDLPLCAMRALIPAVVDVRCGRAGASSPDGSARGGGRAVSTIANSIIWLLQIPTSFTSCGAFALPIHVRLWINVVWLAPGNRYANRTMAGVRKKHLWSTSRRSKASFAISSRADRSDESAPRSSRRRGSSARTRTTDSLASVVVSKSYVCACDMYFSIPSSESSTGCNTAGSVPSRVPEANNASCLRTRGCTFLEKRGSHTTSRPCASADAMSSPDGEKITSVIAAPAS
mmetsp:Transcript_13406/g.34310  ORF Transcript_13406/g.34310 Transcript_13406/m.34310 type:complete len:272 (-) Transcript_13406:749-1564(-)